MPRHETCPTCKRTPVSGKTWSLLTAQDKVLGRQRARIVELEDQLDEARKYGEEMREIANAGGPVGGLEASQPPWSTR